MVRYKRIVIAIIHRALRQKRDAVRLSQQTCCRIGAVEPPKRQTVLILPVFAADQPTYRYLHHRAPG